MRLGGAFQMVIALLWSNCFLLEKVPVFKVACANNMYVFTLTKFIILASYNV